MKTIIYTLLAATLAFFCVTTVYAKDGDARVTQTRKVEPFHAIEITSVANIVFTQSDKYSLRIEGEERLVNNTLTGVTDGTLNIGSKKKRTINNNGVTIYLSAPDLTAFVLRGVGNFSCEKALNLKGNLDIQINGVGDVDLTDLRCHDLRLQLGGVGSIDAKVECNHVKATMNGVGNITLKGHTRTAILKRSGVGEMDADGLKVDEIYSYD